METTTTTAQESSHSSSSKQQQQQQHESSHCCNRRRRCCICWIVLVSLLVVASGAGLAFYFIFFKKDSPNPVASCGECHCILSKSENGEVCPTPKPATEFSSDLISTLAFQIALNPFLLDCNPYTSQDFPDSTQECQTTPPQDASLVALGEDAVCGLHYESTNEGECSTEYRLQSYSSWQAALTAGAFVTHAGACGVCSTTKDLAAYLNSPDLTTEGSYCAKQSILDIQLGKQCYMDLGMTSACSTIWVYNSLNTAEKCLTTCATTKQKPNNGPAPTCTLNECLQCDEDVSGPLFKQFAARTRRRSGLLSAIARPCSALVPIVQSSCPETLPLVDD